MTTITPPEVIQTTLTPPAVVDTTLEQPPLVLSYLNAPDEIVTTLRQPETVTTTLAVGQGPAGTSGGATTLKTAAVDINAYKAVTTNEAGLLIYADAATLTHGDQVLGISAMASLAGGSLMVQTAGELVNPGWSWQPGRAIFLGLNGDITQDPSVGLFSFSLGYAITATSIFIRLGRAIQRA